ncbi:hypothetical protein [Amycolatopsis sp. Hca4]|uniref:hypothetical protein n=1 Tax=Amycolatopsis sp. Hca4 TaxID=2742131 RepID=UPI0015906815|nr:hypothetical protein [Amycolatopsis sp. Hca4]QKV74158.1 hypothetical protein HUT10_10565 [Amycolatopsis sp. Hca4]
MTVLPEWLQLSPEGITVSDYEALPEDVCRRVESGEGSAPQRVIRHVLDPRTQSYVVDGADERALSVTSPFALTVNLRALVG